VRVYPPPGLYGSADWASGYNSEDGSIPIATDDEGWSLLQKGLFFSIILAGIAFYVRMRRQDEKDPIGYEKTLA
jgi:hypothetical protein